MRLFDRLSIKNKLMAIILIVTIAALLGGTTLAIVHDVAAFKTEMVKKVTQVAKITGDFLVTGSAFGDEVEAGKTLASLDVLPYVIYACVYDIDGVRIAEMGTQGQEFELPRPQIASNQFDGNLLNIFHPIDFQGTAYGTLYIQASTAQLYEMLTNHIITMFFILFGSICLSFFLAFKLQTLVTRPILALAATASAISKEGDYSIRVTRETNDEIGVLFDGFNSMLEEIERRDKALRKSEAQYRALFEQATDAIFILDSNGNFIDANPNTCKIVGYSRDELLKLSFSRLIPDEDLKSEPLQLDALKAGKVVARERRFLCKDKRTLTVEVSGKMLDDGRIQVFARDITERRQAENAIHDIAVSFAAVRGEEFFNKVSVYLADKLNVDYAFIGELVDEDKVRVVGGFGKGNDLAPFEYDLKNTPCENVMVQSLCCHTSGVQKLFPKDFLLVEMGIDGYLGAPLFDSSGKSVGIIVLLNEHPITNQKIAESTLQIFSDRVSAEIQRKEAEEALRKNEAKYRMLVENSPYCIHQIDERGRLTSMNRAGLKMMGFSSESEIQGTAYLDVVGENDKHEIQDLLQQAFKGKASEFEFEAANGAIFQSSFVPLADESGHITQLMGITSDITKRNQAEEKIKAALAEKEVMLKEIHHRVKNNLQVISSLLNLQSRYIKDEATLAIFKESRSRVRSMALIHEKLYQTKDFSQVDFSDYARDLSAQLMRANTDNRNQVRLEVDVEGIFLGIDTAVPCGLIINELLTNALQHAFPGGRKGTIKLRLQSKKTTKKKPRHGSKLVLTVSDDGVGLPEGFNIETINTLGMQLVKTLSQQIDGVLKITSGKGANFAITFDAEARKKTKISVNGN